MQNIERSLKENEQRFFKNHLTVSDIMNKEVITLKPTDKLISADDLMNKNLLSHIPITDDKKRLVGLLTKRDILLGTCSYLQKKGSCKKEKILEDCNIEDLMRGGLITISPSTSLKTAAKIMSENNIGSLPVIDDDEVLVGIVTSSDFVDLYGHDGSIH